MRTKAAVLCPTASCSAARHFSTLRPRSQNDSFCPARINALRTCRRRRHWRKQSASGLGRYERMCPRQMDRVHEKHFFARMVIQANPQGRKPTAAANCRADEVLCWLWLPVLPDATDRNAGVVLATSYLGGWKNVPLGSLLESELQIPAVVENDVKLGRHRRKLDGRRARCPRFCISGHWYRHCRRHLR